MLSPVSPEENPPRVTEGRPLVVIFWLMLLAAIWSWSLSWHASLLDRHEFRQLQTAVSTHWLKQDGFRLDYETPLFGPPSWSIPMEFPVYQWCVAQFSRVTGMALEQSGRATSVLFLLATLPAVCALAGLTGLTRPGRLLTAAAVLSSPVYLFYGRAFMIESTALCFATWFLLATGLAVRDLNPRWSMLAALCACGAALAKVTTFAVYCFPAAGLALWLGWPHWQARRQSASGVWRALLLCGGPVAIATVTATWWVRRADAVKDANPFSGFLKSTEMSSWNWGTLDQRFSSAVWNTAWSNVAQFVLSEPATVVLLTCCAVATARVRKFAAAAAAAFLVGPLLFANLYYRHDYYYSANALLLLAGAGLLLAHMWESASLPRAARLTMLALFFGAQLLAFYRGYGFNHRRELPRPPGIATVIRENVPPEGVVLIYGWDWDSIIPYYAQRRAIMVPNGREDELKVLEDILGQLPPRHVAALLLKQRSPTPFPPQFIRDRLARFNLVAAPFASSVDGDLYLPEASVRAALAKPPHENLTGVTFNAQPAAEAATGKLQENNASVLSFPGIALRPTRARSMFGLMMGEADGRPAILAHPVSELYFTPPAGAVRIDAEFGIAPGAYDPEAKATTDGVGIEIVEVRPDGLRRSLYHRELDPVHRPADRGPQPIHLSCGPFSGPVIFRTTPGPANNFTNDWAYWSRIEFE